MHSDVHAGNCRGVSTIKCCGSAVLSRGRVAVNSLVKYLSSVDPQDEPVYSNIGRYQHFRYFSTNHELWS